MNGYRIRPNCRLCSSTSLEKVLELPPTPLANEFPEKPGGEQEEFPLFLVACKACGHVQLPVVIDPERLFRDYVYVSGTSVVFVEHFRRYAEEMIREHVRPGDLVVEIGSNDGTLLRFFQAAYARVLGVDPARAIAASATATGVETWPEFFSKQTAEKIVGAYGHARLVIANNVFAHADDLGSIAFAVKHILEPEGVFVFEVGYLPDILRKTLVDNCYHEHLSQHTLAPLVGFFRRYGMSLVSAVRVDTHGGSVRVTVSPRPDLPLATTVTRLIAEEAACGLDSEPVEAFRRFATTIDERRNEVLRILNDARMGGKSVAGYGAPAKATTLMRTFGIEDALDFVVDDSPLKQGRWMPGGRVPVLPFSSIEERRPDYLVILAWNFAESILEKLSGYRAAGGKCVVPLPEVRVVGSP